MHVKQKIEASLPVKLVQLDDVEPLLPAFQERIQAKEKIVREELCSVLRVVVWKTKEVQSTEEE